MPAILHPTPKPIGPHSRSLPNSSVPLFLAFCFWEGLVLGFNNAGDVGCSFGVVVVVVAMADNRSRTMESINDLTGA